MTHFERDEALLARRYAEDVERGDPDYDDDPLAYDPAEEPMDDRGVNHVLVEHLALDEADAVAAGLIEPPVEECVHGLSAWLCADPVGHYPRDL